MAIGSDAVQQPAPLRSERRAFVIAAVLGAACGVGAGGAVGAPVGLAMLLILLRGARVPDSIFYVFASLGLALLVLTFLVAGYVARWLGPPSIPRGRLGLAATAIIVTGNTLLQVLQWTGLVPRFVWILKHGHFVREPGVHAQLAWLPVNALLTIMLGLAIGLLPAYLGDLWAARRQAKRAREMVAGESDTLGNVQEP
jgi:MFS family permease